MLKITRADNGAVVIKVSGRMDAENVGELEALIRAEVRGRRIVLDLKDLTLVDEGAVSFLRRCEAESIQLKNCPAYIREWITGEGRLAQKQEWQLSNRDRCHSVPRAARVCVTKPKLSRIGIGKH